jgi:photosystem II stability/assembly factor-like uncharacterized protein
MTRSTDSGETWRAVSSGTSTALTEVLPLGGGVVLAVGWDGVIVRSTDYGEHWEAGSAGTSASLSGIGRWRDATWAVGSTGVVLKSTNAGESFRYIESPTKEYLHDVFGDDRLLLAVGTKGSIIGSLDGETWKGIASGTSIDLWGGTVDDQGTLHVVGEKCLYLRSMDRGVSWKQQKMCEGDDTFFTLWGRSAQDLYAVSSSGVIAHSTDGGASWSHASSATNTKLYSIWGDGKGNLIAGGIRGVVRGVARSSAR